MTPGEFAVLFSGEQPPLASESGNPFVPSCVVFPSLAEAEAYARAQIEGYPKLRCSIYDHHGLGQEPLTEIAGQEGRDRNEITAGFRRWVGGSLLLIGVILGAAEWASDFRLSWAGMVGSRIGPAGAILVLTEIGVVLSANQRARRAKNPPS